MQQTLSKWFLCSNERSDPFSKNLCGLEIRSQCYPLGCLMRPGRAVSWRGVQVRRVGDPVSGDMGDQRILSVGVVVITVQQPATDKKDVPTVGGGGDRFRPVPAG